MDNDTHEETTKTNELPPKTSTKKDNTDKEMSKGQVDKDTKAQEESNTQSNSRIQEYTISTSNPDIMRRTHHSK